MEYKNLPDIRGWAALRAVIERGSVSDAAHVLNIGQPAVTKRLRALEESYGESLTERVGGRMQLTKAGEKVYLLAVQTLDKQLALRRELLDLAKGRTTLHLDVTIAIGEHLLPHLLLSFSESHPDFRIDSRLVYGRQIQNDLASGLADLALMERPPDHPDLMVQKWMDDELLLVCGPRHPLANEDMIPIAMLPDLSYVLRERGSSPRVDLDEALTRIGLSELDVALEVGSTDTIIEVLMPGSHVSFLPRFAVIDDIKRDRLHHIKVDAFRIMRTLWIARHRDNIAHPVADAFIDIMRKDNQID
ncbi:MAG: LysR family transcriptional regulator [Rhodospirillaceae bacterium]|jgi:DNA-binding transcriptional LysR family regulator|nr:LysR family transcriptional regulator [Rhodospirillaceae bacterium]MBT4219734.1 LysR family transcriptional regulator [Rhodospirillaceae bacterium]MBT5014150.1 LysR family transcriptional regulator [Rhodospirillaceae bacterium]MBT5308146.1 LysR family transcriptional regulator [Rhodospirillaceae bacterium]MBT6406287.1 LysR family transcriptional regulator [Rhodospirillaceae bacterium]